MADAGRQSPAAPAVVPPPEPRRGSGGPNGCALPGLRHAADRPVSARCAATTSCSRRRPADHRAGDAARSAPPEVRSRATAGRRSRRGRRPGQSAEALTPQRAPPGPPVLRRWHGVVGADRATSRRSCGDGRRGRGRAGLPPVRARTPVPADRQQIRIGRRSDLAGHSPEIDLVEPARGPGRVAHARGAARASRTAWTLVDPGPPTAPTSTTTARSRSRSTRRCR